MFDEPPDDDPHGQCAAEIERLTGLVRWAYSKLHARGFTDLDDAMKLDEMKLLLETTGVGEWCSPGPVLLEEARSTRHYLCGARR